ncbi:MAG TPA: amidophosphoribosyltransferase [Candidatus Butyricicoccus avistercoris]|uniref:Amidophosphoribosyltransferase n=1 Tax=Candidatus Butyricicoccus avistercoris TaxID=2838518 RepID=A0A9D1PH58_9FIRM|nr:amidophosphoribosyltransferase [Candidatus Butyricicoccus avistercoris]
MKYKMRKLNHTPFDSDAVHEECGVFGIYVPDGCNLSPSHEAYTALFALQHRGQEACGIAVNNRGVIKCHKDIGLVNDVFDQQILDSMVGQMAIGHVRYSTTGDPHRENAQPLSITHVKGNLAVAHNGNLVNASELRKEIENTGGIFRSTSDTEVLVYTIVRERLKCGSIEEAVLNTMNVVQGAYSLCIMSPRKLIAARDPRGMRPLCMGKTAEGAIIFASESCALDALGAEFVRDIEPGEVVIVEGGEIRSLHSEVKCKSAACVFEYIYFARPDSVIDGASVELARQEAGKYLSIEHPVGADVVIGVPDSGIPAAIGYAKCSGIPYGVGLIKNRYIGRTFIQPGQSKRERSVRLKLNALREAVNGKRVIMVDDSIVRGTTCARLVKLVRDAGAKEVHMRISAPPFRHPCFFGTDIPERTQLLAHERTVEEMRQIIGVDSLGFLSVEATRRIALNCKLGFCDACFTGEYPMEVPNQVDKNMFESEIEL